jgi:hypothetical protein
MAESRGALIWALKNWRLIAAGLAVLGLLGAAWWIDSRAYKRGVGATKAQYERKLFEAQQKAQFELSKMEKGYDLASQKVRSISGGCVGPAMRYSHDWLREHRRNPE